MASVSSGEKVKLARYAAVPLQLPDIVCDIPFKDELNNHPMTSTFNGPFVKLFIGGMGTGKTTLTNGLMNTPQLLYGVFKHIFVFMPKSSRKSVAGSFYAPLEEKGQVFDQLTAANFMVVRDRAQRNWNKDPKKFTLVIFDDVQHAYDGVHDLLLDTVAGHRHIGLSFIFLCQSYKAMPKKIRSLASHVWMFSVGQTETEEIREEIIKRPKKQWAQVQEHYLSLIEAASREVYSTKLRPRYFLMVHTNSGRIFVGDQTEWNEFRFPLINGEIQQAAESPPQQSAEENESTGKAKKRGTKRKASEPEGPVIHVNMSF